MTASSVQGKSTLLDGEPGFDPTALERIRDIAPGLVVNVLDAFLADAPGRVKRIEAGRGVGDVETLRSEAHALKSSAAYLGADLVARLAAEVEASCRSGESANALEISGHLRDALIYAIEWFGEILAVERSR